MKLRDKLGNDWGNLVRTFDPSIDRLEDVAQKALERGTSA